MFTEYQEVTGDTTALPNSIVDVDSTDGVVNVELPSPDLGVRVCVWRRTGGNLVVVDAGNARIESAATAYITADQRKITLVGTGTGWLVESHGRSTVSLMMGDLYVA
jgi:hypothetical protein